MTMENRLLQPGTMLRGGTYRVERQLSSGGFGNTYVVTNVNFEETFAMKEFYMKDINMRSGNTVTVSIPDNKSTFDTQRNKFMKEAKRLRKLTNNHIVGVHDLFEENGTTYYIMDFIDGESLSARLKRTGQPLAGVFDVAFFFRPDAEKLVKRVFRSFYYLAFSLRKESFG